MVTHQEILTLTHVVGRITQSAFEETSEGATGDIRLSVVEDPHGHLHPQCIETTSNTLQLMNDTGRYSSCKEVPATRGKDNDRGIHSSPA